MVTMTDQEVLAELRSGSRLEAARRAFSSACARLEQEAAQQRQPRAPVELRRLEYEAVVEVLAAYGVGAPDELGEAGEVLRRILRMPRPGKETP